MADQSLLCSGFKACPILHSRSVGAFMDKCHAFYKVGSAKKSWEPLYWLMPPRPPRGAISFPSLSETRKGVCLHLGCQKMYASETFLRTLALWTTNTLPAGTTVQVCRAAPCKQWNRKALRSAIIRQHSANGDYMRITTRGQTR